MKRERNLRLGAWALSVMVCVLAVVAWGSMYRWELRGLNTYQLFPLFGLLAFSFMWAHYVMDAVKTYFDVAKTSLSNYFEVTSGAVLVLILAHPGLFIWQLWRDGLGLPPGSYKSYVGSKLYIFVLFGLLSLLAFLAYEFRGMLKNPRWKNWVQYASDGAMILILIHGFRLGSTLQNGWFKSLWLVYAMTFVLSLVYVRLKQAPKDQK